MSADRPTRRRRLIIHPNRIVTGAEVSESFRRAGEVVARDLEGMPAAVLRFFETLFRSDVTNGSVLAHAIGLSPSTLNSRFLRADLPSPRLYVATARLVVAADLLARFKASSSSVSIALGYSSPAAFGRTVKLLTGLTVSDFREDLGGNQMLLTFRDEQVLPYLGTFRTLESLDTPAMAVRA